MSEPTTITDFEFHFANGQVLYTAAVNGTWAWITHEPECLGLTIAHEDGSHARWMLFKDKLNAVQTTERVEVEPSTVLDVNGVPMMGE